MSLDDRMDRYCKNQTKGELPYSQAHKKMQECDWAVSDLLHYVELGDLSNGQLFGAAKLLKRYLSERRRYKDRCKFLELLRNNSLPTAMRISSRMKSRKYKIKYLKNLEIYKDNKKQTATTASNETAK